MKKVLPFFLLCVLCLGWLGGCGKSGEAVVPDREDLKLLEARTPEPFSREETERMICFMSANRALLSGGRLYGLGFDENYLPFLVSYSFEDSALSDWFVLAGDCVPEYLCTAGERLYYINAQAGNAIESIALDGSDRQVLYEGPCSFLQIYEDSLYYCDANGFLCRAGLDGGAGTSILEKSCFYPYLSGGVLIYQDGETEHLRLRWLEDGSDIELTGHAAYAPVVIGDQIYYTGEDGLMYMGLDGLAGGSLPVSALQGAVEFYFSEEDPMARGVTDEDGLYQWTLALNGGEATPEYAQERGYMRCDFAGGGYRIDAVYNADGRLRCFLLTAPDGSAIEYTGQGGN